MDELNNRTVPDDVVETAKRLYSASTANDPNIHCNRLSPWDDLTDNIKSMWIEQAALQSRPADNTGLVA